MEFEMGLHTETSVAAVAIKWPCFNDMAPWLAAVVLSQLVD